MPQLKLKTTWSHEEICEHAVALVSDDTHWMVQAESTTSMVLRREKYMPWWKWATLVTVVVLTCGFGWFLFPLMFIGFKSQQISILTKESEGGQIATITYTPGAKGVVNSLYESIPKLKKKARS